MKNHELKNGGVTGTRAITLLLIIGLVAGCGKKKEASGQVVATVNGTEISIYQLNGALTRTAGVTAQNAQEYRSKVLDKLIDQQLAISKAQQEELDRSPEVIQALEDAKREILSRSYLDKISSSIAKTTVEEARSYYKVHPELFADRHVYQFLEMATPLGRAPVDTIREMMAKMTQEELEAWVTSKKIQHLMNVGVRAAEQMPTTTLQTVLSMKVGDITAVQNGDTMSILKLLAAQSAPVTEAVAVPQIQRLLDGQNSLKAVTADLTQLRAKAKIEIVGMDAKAAAERKATIDAAAAAASAAAVKIAPPPAPVRVPTPAPKPIPVPPVVKAPPAKPVPSGPPAGANLEKGVAGLK